MTRECLTCSRLGLCPDTDIDKLLAHFACVLWEEVRSEITSARITAIQQYGKTGAQALVTPEAAGEET